MPSLFSAINPPLFLPVILTSRTTSSSSLKSAMNDLILSLRRAFLCETAGLSFLNPVITTGITSPTLHVMLPFSSVTSDAFNRPSDFLPTSTRMTSSLIATTTPLMSASLSESLKDSSNIAAKSISSCSSTASV